MGGSLMEYGVHRRRVFLGPVGLPARQRLAYSWKLRTLVVMASSIGLARIRARELGESDNEHQDVRRCSATLATWYAGHQSARSPGGVGML